MTDTVWKFEGVLSVSSTDSDFAFLILNQPILCDPRVIKSMWSKASLRAIVDGGSNRWLTFLRENKTDELKLPDFISGDFDSVKPETKTYFEGRGVTLIPTPDQDETDFTKALKCVKEILEAKNLHVKWIFVLCENGGRFDQEMGNINTLHRCQSFLKDIPVIILSSQSITWVLNPGKHTICVTDDYIKSQYACGLIPLTGPTVITTSGLKWDLDNQTSVMAELVSTSNTYAANKVNVTCDKCVVWTTQYCKIN